MSKNEKKTSQALAIATTLKLKSVANDLNKVNNEIAQIPLAVRSASAGLSVMKVAPSSTPLTTELEAALQLHKEEQVRIVENINKEIEGLKTSISEMKSGLQGLLSNLRDQYMLIKT